MIVDFPGEGLVLVGALMCLSACFLPFGKSREIEIDDADDSEDAPREPGRE